MPIVRDAGSAPVTGTELPNQLRPAGRVPAEGASSALLSCGRNLPGEGSGRIPGEVDHGGLD